MSLIFVIFVTCVMPPLQKAI